MHRSCDVNLPADAARPCSCLLFLFPMVSIPPLPLAQSPLVHALACLSHATMGTHSDWVHELSHKGENLGHDSSLAAVPSSHACETLLMVMEGVVELHIIKGVDVIDRLAKYTTGGWEHLVLKITSL